MGMHSVAGRSAATAATSDNVGAALWNPAAAKILWVTEISWFKTVATADIAGLVRTSTRGTQTSTVTPDADNAYARDLTNSAAGVLDVTYSAQPTIQGPYLWRIGLPAAVAAGFIKVFKRPIAVPPGTGLAIATPVATILQPGDVAFEFED
jgi:hypothetical protein